MPIFYTCGNATVPLSLTLYNFRNVHDKPASSNKIMVPNSFQSAVNVVTLEWDVLVDFSECDAV